MSEKHPHSEQAPVRPQPGQIGGARPGERSRLHLSQEQAVQAGNEALDINEIADLVTVDSKGRGHISDSNNPHGRSKAGQFISRKQLEQIAAHQDTIRGGLAGLALENAGVDQPEVEVSRTDTQEPEPVAAAPETDDTPANAGEMTKDEFMDSEFMREMPIEMAQELAIALNDYMRLSAMRSRATGKGGKTSLTPRYVKRANGEQITSNYAGIRATAKNVEASRKRYEQVRRRAKHWTAEKMAEKGVALKDQKLISYLEDKTEIELIGLGIQFDQERLSDPKGFAAKTRKQFYNWWGRQGSGKFFSWGTAKKAGAMAAIGLPVGVAAGLGGAFIAGPLAGGVAAAAVARGVSRGLLRGHVEKQANAKTVAATQREQHQSAQIERLNEQYRNDERVLSLTDEFSGGVERNVRRNRRRMLGSVAIGAVAGLGGAFAGEALHNAFSGGQPEDTNGRGGKSPEDKKPGRGRGGRRPEHGRTGQSFRVEEGSGIIREIDQYAEAHNYRAVSPQEATEIYNRLHAQFGRDIVDLQGSGPDTYLVGDDVRLTHPGMAHWGPGVEAALRAELRKAS